jgi:hypothetical protein
MSAPDMSMPPGWEHHPNWDSNASIWDEMKGQGNAVKDSSKKRKKQAHNSEPQSDSLIVVRKKATREYLARSLTLTIIDETLATETWLVIHALALQEAEQASVMICLFNRHTFDLNTQHPSIPLHISSLIASPNISHCGLSLITSPKGSTVK